jgi:hypothetical protein
MEYALTRGDILHDISSLKRICSVKRGYDPAHILLAKDMLSEEGICSCTYHLCRGYALTRWDMLLDISSLQRICSDKRGYDHEHILFAEAMIWQEGIFSWIYPLCRGYALTRGDILLDISSLQRICSDKRWYAPGHIFFAEHMHSQEGICSWTYPLCRGYALTRGDMLQDISSLKQLCSDKRGYAPRHFLFEEDMLSQEGIYSCTNPLCRGYAQWRGDMLPDISSLKGICSVKRGYAPGHILFAEDMLLHEGICSWTYPLCRGYALTRGDMILDISSLKGICSVKRGYAPRHILFAENMLWQEGICSKTYPLCRGYAQPKSGIQEGFVVQVVDKTQWREELGSKRHLTETSHLRIKLTGLHTSSQEELTGCKHNQCVLVTNFIT